MMKKPKIEDYFDMLVRPKKNSRKGENGRVLVIGGSRLFHAASAWAAQATSRIVDMVHFASPATENNELMRVRAKSKFWEGIVVAWEDVEHYIAEDDCILIGPGMERGEATRRVVNGLLAKYPEKRWVVDGGALQEVAPELLNERIVVTPNAREFGRLTGGDAGGAKPKEVERLARVLSGATVLAKGPVDVISNGRETVEVEGGNAGMTKGGTGDVLAGVLAGLYAKSPAFAAAVAASYVNKKAGERVAEARGIYYNAADLANVVPEVMREVLG